MIVKDSLPLDSTEKDGFKYFIKMALPHYAVPGRTKITYLLDNKFDALKCIAKAQISEVNCLSITADIWTETTNTRSFLGATAHYIHNYKFCNVFICLEELDAAHTAEYIKERLLNVCEDWNIAVPKIAALITDNGANITKASADLVGKSRNLPCFSHTLNLVASKVCDIENIAPLVSSVKAIVTFFRQSVSAADELRKVTNLRPIASVPTRWNSTYFMLQRFMDIRNEIGTVLLKFPRSPRMLTAAELQQVEEVLQLLSPLEQASTEMCGEKYVTGSKIIPLVNILQKQFSALHLETQNGQCMKTTLLQELKKRFGKMEEVQLLSIATLLDPRFKRLHFGNPLGISNAIVKIKQLLLQANNEEGRNNVANTETVPLETDAEFELSIWNYHNELVKSTTVVDPSDDSENELKHYLNQKIVSIKEDPLLFWERHKTVYPNLTNIALKYLTVVATSVPAERMFSKAGIVMEPHRNRLLPSRLGKLVFLNSLSAEQWHL
jgi:hypothetical protein